MNEVPTDQCRLTFFLNEVSSAPARSIFSSLTRLGLAGFTVISWQDSDAIPNSWPMELQRQTALVTTVFPWLVNVSSVIPCLVWFAGLQGGPKTCEPVNKDVPITLSYHPMKHNLCNDLMSKKKTFLNNHMARGHGAHPTAGKVEVGGNVHEIRCEVLRKLDSHSPLWLSVWFTLMFTSFSWLWSCLNVEGYMSQNCYHRPITKLLLPNHYISLHIFFY